MARRNNNVPHRLLALQAVFLIGIWFASSSGSKKSYNSDDATNTMMLSTSTTSRILYKLVHQQRETDDPSSYAYIRYAAWNEKDNQPISISTWANLLANDSSTTLRNDLIELLRGAPYEAF